MANLIFCSWRDRTAYEQNKSEMKQKPGKQLNSIHKQVKKNINLTAWLMSYMNPLYPITTCTLPNPWTSATRVAYCFPQKIMPFFSSRNSGQTWSTLSNFEQNKEESLSCTVPKHTNLAKKAGAISEQWKGMRMLVPGENMCTWSSHDVSVVQDISYIG